jgi:hypothetical protein
VTCNRGGPDNPLSTEELRVKFMGNAARVLPRERANELADRILDRAALPASALMAATIVGPAREATADGGALGVA